MVPRFWLPFPVLLLALLPVHCTDKSPAAAPLDGSVTAGGGDASCVRLASEPDGLPEPSSNAGIRLLLLWRLSSLWSSLLLPLLVSAAAAGAAVGAGGLRRHARQPKPVLRIKERPSAFSGLLFASMALLLWFPSTSPAFSLTPATLPQLASEQPFRLFLV